MDIFRFSRNPWGQEVLEGVSWDLLWVFFGLGLAFICLHLIYVRIRTHNRQK